MIENIENQRRADLGNGTYLNPILSGDRPDPSILKDGGDYYMVHSSFLSYPGLLIWHSQDLVNWRPIAAALRRNVGSVWAPDLVKHNGRYFIYFPAKKGGQGSNYVVWADCIEGPWSDPIDLKIGQIDPGHAVGADGQRYLFMSGGYRINLADDGLAVRGKMTKVYDGWKFPEEWDSEGFAQEGPKMLRRGDYYYMIVAEGGTAGPPTSHMVVVARSKSIDGPWENSPYNPVVKTWRREEKWWSKGHATLVEGPDGKWYLVYHAYENGFYTLGRQTLLEPVVWTDDGWIKSSGADVAKPIPIPSDGKALPHGLVLSDDFSKDKVGIQWTFHDPGDDYEKRYRFENGSLILKGQGQSPRDCSPLCFIAGDQAYEVEAEIEVSGEAQGGLILFYSDKLYAGRGFDGKDGFPFHRYGEERTGKLPQAANCTIRMRLVNDRHVVRIFHSLDGHRWIKDDRGLEVSGYHHNVAGGFMSLRPAIYAAGNGEVKFRNIKYRALPAEARSDGRTARPADVRG